MVHWSPSGDRAVRKILGVYPLCGVTNIHRRYATLTLCPVRVTSRILPASDCLPFYPTTRLSANNAAACGRCAWPFPTLSPCQALAFIWDPRIATLHRWPTSVCQPSKTCPPLRKKKRCNEKVYFCPFLHPIVDPLHTSSPSKSARLILMVLDRRLATRGALHASNSTNVLSIHASRFLLL